MSGSALKTSAAKLAELATKLVSPCSRPRACWASSAYRVGLSVAVIGAASNPLRVRLNEMQGQVFYYRAMPEPSVSSEFEVRRERTESARLDNFVDGAFAFAITLLLISGATMPRDVAALEHALLGVPAFAVCFAQLAWF